MKKANRIASVCAVVLIATACGRGTPEGAQGANGNEHGPAGEAGQLGGRVLEVVSPLISSSVSTMETCDPVKAMLQWDVSRAHPSTKIVQVWVGPDPASASLFSESGPSGSAETDTWVRPGTTGAPAASE